MKPVISLFALLLSVACVGAAREKDAQKTVKITEDSFSNIYPAVWFAPSDGTITPLTEKSEKPPKPRYKIWIEPRDPEISTLDLEAAEDGTQGFQILGHGKTHFEKPVVPEEKKLVSRVASKDLEKPQAVLLYVDGKKSYVMLIESFSKDKQELTFQWKALASD